MKRDRNTTSDNCKLQLQRTLLKELGEGGTIKIRGPQRFDDGREGASDFGGQRVVFADRRDGADDDLNGCLDCLIKLFFEIKKINKCGEINQINIPGVEGMRVLSSSLLLLHPTDFYFIHQQTV